MILDYVMQMTTTTKDCIFANRKLCTIKKLVKDLNVNRVRLLGCFFTIIKVNRKVKWNEVVSEIITSKIMGIWGIIKRERMIISNTK